MVSKTIPVGPCILFECLRDSLRLIVERDPGDFVVVEKLA